MMQFWNLRLEEKQNRVPYLLANSVDLHSEIIEPHNLGAYTFPLPKQGFSSWPIQPRLSIVSTSCRSELVREACCMCGTYLPIWMGCTMMDDMGNVWADGGRRSVEPYYLTLRDWDWKAIFVDSIHAHVRNSVIFLSQGCFVLVIYWEICAKSWCQLFRVNGGQSFSVRIVRWMREWQKTVDTFLNFDVLLGGFLMRYVRPRR